MPLTVALTGATGFIGAMIARDLARTGWRVRALVRAASASKLPPDTALETVTGSLEDPASLERLVRGSEAVVHCAGAVRGATQADFDQINVTGVTRLAETCAALRPTPRFLLLSSLAAREPELSAYARSKRRGEEALARAAGDMPWLALRPPAVYGPGDREMLPLFRLAGLGIGPILAPAHARASLLYVEDLASAVRRWAEHGAAVQGVFELHDGHVGGYSWNDVMDVAAALCQRRIARIRIPAVVLKSAAVLSLLVSRLTGQAPMLTPGKVRELRHPDWVCDNGPLTEAIGWMPRFPLELGLRQTPGWRRHDP